ncbi:MAG: DUF362 domain-containing protein [Bacteroidales bacterium]|jgi:uncharacterized Fe-S center protein|nr:DUF362 domain-containing protein [Bacteroidales bacterium]
MKRSSFLFIIVSFAVVFTALSFSCDKGNNSGSEISEGTGSSDDTSIVYMINEISPESLIKIYEALGREAKGKVGIKLHMGEPGGNNYLKPELVGKFVKSVDGTFIDANTAYGGQRSTAESHLRVAEQHGFTAIGDVDILDADGEMELPITGGIHLTADLIGSHFANYDFTVILTHFKGHQMGGFGGAIKNMSVGIASVAGKCLIHTAGASSTSMWNGAEQDDFLEAMAEAAKGVAQYCGENILYINVMNNLSVDCDCSSSPQPARIEDVGILASLDPVALDKACVDLVYNHRNPEKKHLVERIESRNGIHVLTYGEKIGLGTQNYKLIIIE